MSVLTPREREVALLVTRGLLNKQIAYELDISIATVKAHIASVMRKLDAPNRRHVAALMQLSDPAAESR